MRQFFDIVSTANGCRTDAFMLPYPIIISRALMLSQNLQFPVIPHAVPLWSIRTKPYGANMMLVFIHHWRLFIVQLRPACHGAAQESDHVTSCRLTTLYKINQPLCANSLLLLTHSSPSRSSTSDPCRSFTPHVETKQVETCEYQKPKSWAESICPRIAKS